MDTQDNHESRGHESLFPSCMKPVTVYQTRWYFDVRMDQFILRGLRDLAKADLKALESSAPIHTDSNGLDSAQATQDVRSKPKPLALRSGPGGCPGWYE